MGKELLDISTIVDRDTITITSKLHPAGKSYEVLGANELSLFDSGVIQAKVNDIADLDLKKKQTPAQAKKHTGALRALVQIAVPSIERSVLLALSDTFLLAIFGVFNKGGAEGESGNARSGRTSAASSQGSPASTAAPRKRGSKPPAGS